MHELESRLNRDVKRVHEDASVLVELWLIEKGERGALNCPFDNTHVDMMMSARPVA